MSSEPGGGDRETQVDDSEEDSFCGKCGKLYQEETDEPQVSIECSLCNQWFHFRMIWRIVLAPLQHKLFTYFSTVSFMPVYTLKADTYPVAASARTQHFIPRITGFCVMYCFRLDLPLKAIMASCYCFPGRQVYLPRQTPIMLMTGLVGWLKSCTWIG